MHFEPTGDFWQYHGIFFCLFLLLFPRLTMLVTGVCFAPYAGLLFWIGFVLAPRITVAVLATYFYFHTNPIVCVLAWVFAFSGEGGEKTVVLQNLR